MSEKRRALGRGLGALIPSSPSDGVRPVDVFFPDRPGRDARDGVTAAGSPGSTTDTSTRLGDPSATVAAVVSDDASAEGDDATVTSPGGAVAPRGAEPASDGPHDAPELAAVPGVYFAELAVSAIRPNPRQPRKVFDEDDMAELVSSISEIGVLQPVVVRPIPDGAERAHIAPGVDFELIMGERRWRASQLAGMDTVPAIVKETKDDNLLRDALLENLHRSQLNPLEEAAAYQQLLDDFGCSQEELATRIGRSRPQISNTLRLLRLPPVVARRLAAGVLSAGHARALLGLDDAAAMERLAQRIVAEGLSVRSVEEIVSLGGDPGVRPARRPRAGARRPQLDDVAARLSDHFDTRVTLALGQRKGRLTVEFASVDDLHRIMAVMGVKVDED
ncbi:MAG: ParB/RepB/Spo0J family partition protein [Actinomycetota bacterium]|nr:ParB/RepB/Spo0J family partition protein [Actinomycetota bacterium]